MGIAQMGALSGGRKFRRPYVEEINARTPYLPQLYGQKKAQQHRDRMYGLGQRGLAQEKEFGLKELGLREDMAHEARKKNRYAQNLGYANLGLAGAFGAYDAMGQPSISDIGDWFSPSDALGGIENLGMWDPTGFSGGDTSGGDAFDGLFNDTISEILDWGDMF